jgi:hypothetical protein
MAIGDCLVPVLHKRHINVLRRGAYSNARAFARRQCKFDTMMRCFIFQKPGIIVPTTLSA